MLIVLDCSSKAQKKELLKHLKPDTIKAICECTTNIINRNIKVSDLEKRKINGNRDKIRERGAFLPPLFAPVLGSLMGPILKGITRR